MAMIHHMSDVKSDPEEGLFHHNLPWRDDNFKELMHRCDASLSLIRKYGRVSTTADPRGQNYFIQF